MQKRADRVAQVVEYLPSKLKVLRATPSTTKIKIKNFKNSTIEV
jgi:hypothetical protein